MDIIHVLKSLVCGVTKRGKKKICLCVDDFGDKYFSKDDADRLLTALHSRYKISVDYEGMHYCGLTIERNYEKGDVSTFLCQNIFPLRYKNYKAQNLPSLDMLRILGSSQPMANAYKWQQLTNLKI